MHVTLILVLSTALFLIGLAVIFTKKNALFMLMGVELMLNAANINFIAFNGNSHNQAIPLFVIAIAAAESASSDADKINLIGE